MDPQMRFRINRPEVVCESFDGEIVAIHFASGNYYSLVGVAARILELLDAGHTLGEVGEAVSCLYDVHDHDLARTVHEFAAELQEENLIVARDSVDLPSRANSEFQSPVERSAFKPPRLEKFSDMQDLLLLDPIHDVDDAGWPSAAPATRSAG